MPVLLVAVALLLCHGAFGYAHQLALTDAPASSAAHAGGTDGHHPAPAAADGEHPTGAYFATLLVLILATTPLPGLGKQVEIQRPVPPSSGRRLRSKVLHLPRGPTLPVLQVFRL